MDDAISKYISDQAVTSHQNEESTSDNDLQWLPKRKKGEAGKVYIFIFNCVNGFFVFKNVFNNCRRSALLKSLNSSWTAQGPQLKTQIVRYFIVN